jgi:hypothetical protein
LDRLEDVVSQRLNPDFPVVNHAWTVQLSSALDDEFLEEYLVGPDGFFLSILRWTAFHNRCPALPGL